jgi:transcriptional regulator with XRE-family HTH domain
MGSKFEPDYKAIGIRIRQARKKQNMTQEKLAEMTDLSTSHMSHIERGNTKVSLPSLIMIANALHVTVDSLLHDNIEASYEAFDKDFHDLINDCSPQEKEVILQASVQVKKALKR